MGGSENLKKGVRFSKEYQPAKRGRLPSKLKKFIKDYELSKSDIDAIFRNLIFTHSVEDLKKMVADESKNKLPVIVALCVSAFLHDLECGTLNSANTVLDRLVGKPSQHIDATVTTVTAEERAALENALRGGDD